tara:strand:+ start:512 stop:1024 length:513 start_codon:yes stop_codon:yes gene_type:complete
MATKLQFITSSSATAVETISITDCFSNSYDVYLIILDVFDVSSTYSNTALRYRNSSGDITSSTYDAAHQDLDSSTSFGEGSYTNNDRHEAIQISDDTRDGSSGILYIFNPFDSSSFTFHTMQNQGSNATEFRGRKGIGVEKTAQQITGITFFSHSSGQSASFQVTVYGVK